MAITHIGVGAQAVSVTNGATVTAAWPAGYTAVADDVAVFRAGGLHNNTSTLTPATPSGYTLVGSRWQNAATYDPQLAVWIKVLTVGEAAPATTVPAAYANSSGGMSVAVSVWRGVDVTNPQDVAAVLSGSVGAVTFTPTGLTTVTDGAVVLSEVLTNDDNALDFGGSGNAQGFTAVMSGADYDVTLGGDHSFGEAYKVISPAGAVTMPTWNESVNMGVSDEWCAITLALRPAASGTPPTITAENPQDAVEDVAYSNYTFTATGDATITWAVQTGALPTGLSLSSAGVLSGTPTTPGTYNFTVRATNSAGTDDSGAITVIITATPVPPTITAENPPDGTVSATYPGYTFTATGDATITWAVQTGSLPTGLTLSTAGVLTGTPTAAGTFTFTVRATNGAGTDDSASIDIVVTGTPWQGWGFHQD